jgi:hypothetical protein
MVVTGIKPPAEVEGPAPDMGIAAAEPNNGTRPLADSTADRVTAKVGAGAAQWLIVVGRALAGIMAAAQCTLAEDMAGADTVVVDMPVVDTVVDMECVGMVVARWVTGEAGEATVRGAVDRDTVVVDSVAVDSAAGMVIMVEAARMAAPVVGVEGRVADMVMPVVRVVDRSGVVVAAISVIVDMVVGGKAETEAGSAKRAVAVEAGSAAVPSVVRADQDSAGSALGDRWAAGPSSAAEMTAETAIAARRTTVARAIDSRMIDLRATAVGDHSASAVPMGQVPALVVLAAEDLAAVSLVRPATADAASEPLVVVMGPKGVPVTIKPPATDRAAAPAANTATTPVPVAAAIVTVPIVTVPIVTMPTAAVQIAVAQIGAVQIGAVQIGAVQIEVARVAIVVARRAGMVLDVADGIPAIEAMRRTRPISFSRSCSD